MPVLILIIATVVSGIGVDVVRRWALDRNVIDVPNSRSLHTDPTPRGGGLSIVLTAILGALVLALSGHLPWHLALALCVGGLVAGIGFVDDSRGVSPRVRLIVHTTSAILGVVLVGGMPPLSLGFVTWQWSWFGHLVAVVGTVWMINLYNFMDGIDGLAGSEGVFVFASAGLLFASTGMSELTLLSTLLAGACLGFLRQNWPPAKIFMGDVASGFLGHAVAILAIASAHSVFPLLTWLILAGVFVVDATVTLLRRWYRGRHLSQAHRSHGYQHAVARGYSHRAVTLTISVLNVICLLPLAIASVHWPAWAFVVTLLAVSVLVVIAVLFRAGTETNGEVVFGASAQK